MRDLLCPVCKARNNEEYRAVLKKRQLRMCLFILAGFLTEVIVLAAYFCMRISLPDYQMGFLLGLGAGLAFGGMVALIKIHRLLADEEKLKESRLKETDERELEVNSLALRGTARILLAVLYVLIILGGILVNDEMMRIGWGLLAVFFGSNLLLKKYYGSKL